MAYRNIEEEVGGRIKNVRPSKKEGFAQDKKTKDMTKQRRQRFEEKRSEFAD